MPSDLAAVLNRAADLIEPPGAWTQGALARDATGSPVPVYEPSAVSFCVAGAVIRETNGCEMQSWSPIHRALATRDHRFTSASVWQDQHERTQAEAVQLLRDAARLAEHEETTR